MTDQRSDDRLAPAKAIFRHYLGSKHLMSRDGAEREYDSYAVTAQQEARWRKELIEELANQLSPDEVEALIPLRTMDATEAIPRLLEIAPLGDSYAQLQYADALWEMARRCPWTLTPELAERSKNAAIERWQSIATNPPSVNDGRLLPKGLSADGIGGVARERLSNISKGLDALNPGSNPPRMDVIDRSLLALFQWIERGWQRLRRRP